MSGSSGGTDAHDRAAAQHDTQYTPDNMDMELEDMARQHKAKTKPNEGLLISTLSLQEAQSSSEIENIITTSSGCIDSCTVHGAGEASEWDDNYPDRGGWGHSRSNPKKSPQCRPFFSA